MSKYSTAATRLVRQGDTSRGLVSVKLASSTTEYPNGQSAAEARPRTASWSMFRIWPTPTQPLDTETPAVLKGWREEQSREKEEWGELWTDTGLAFTREDGSASHPDRISKLFEGAVQAPGLPRIRLHDLRHAHATVALGAGVHPKVVSDRLGHSTVGFTLDVYSRCVSALAQDAAEKIAALVSAAE